MHTFGFLPVAVGYGNGKPHMKARPVSARVAEITSPEQDPQAIAAASVISRLANIERTILALSVG